jgi:hypothetical protein
MVTKAANIHFLESKVSYDVQMKAKKQISRLEKPGATATALNYMKSVKGKPAFVGASAPKERPISLTRVPLKANLKLLVAQADPEERDDLF